MVENGKYQTLTETPRAVVFEPAQQVYDEATVLVVRSALPGTEMARQLRQTFASLDAQLPLYAAGSVRQMVDLAYLPARAATVALGAFGALAMMLAIYGLAAYTVSRCLREIGIRVAIGARGPQVLRSLLGRIGGDAGGGPRDGNRVCQLAFEHRLSGHAARSLGAGRRGIHHGSCGVGVGLDSGSACFGGGPHPVPAA